MTLERDNNLASRILGTLPRGRGAIDVMMLVSLGAVNKGLGFLREAVMAAKFGADIRMDGLLAGQTIPAVLSKVMDEILGASLLPLFASWTTQKGEAIAWARLKQIVFYLLLGASVVVLSLLVFSGPVMTVLAPGLGAEGIHIAVRSLQIMLPSIAFFLLGSMLTAILNYYGRFFWGGLAATLGNAFSLLCILLYARQLDVYSVAIGITGGALLLVIFQVPFVPRAARTWDTGNEAGARFGEFAKMAGPFGFAILLFNAIPFVERFLGSLLREGSLAILNYAFKVDWLVYSVFAIPVTTVTFPALASAAALQDTTRFQRVLALGVKGTLLLIAPCMVILVSLAVPIIQLLFQRGMFGPEQTARTASVLVIYVFGLPGASISLILFYALYALGQPAVRLTASVLSVLLSMICGWVFTRFWDVQGIAWAHVVTLSLVAAYMAWALRVLLGQCWSALISFVLRLCGAGLVSAVVCIVIYHQLALWITGDPIPAQVARIGVPSAVTLVVFYLLCWLWKVEEVKRIPDILWKARRIQASGIL